MKHMAHKNVAVESRGYDIIKKIGSGGYSDVYLINHKYTNKNYALKVIRKFIKKRDKTKHIMQEIKVLSMCDHPNIIKLYEWFETRDHFYLILEYIECKDLKHFFRFHPPSEKDAIYIIRQIAQAIKFCHDKAIIHRDIKLANVLVDNDGNIKLGDFGLSIIKEYSDDTFTTMAGTPHFKAPEIILRQEYNEAIDIWSFGVLIYTLLTEKYPFNGENEESIDREILNGHVSYSTFKLNSSIIHLLKHMLVMDPLDRYTIDEVLAHPWLSNNQSFCKHCEKCHEYTKK